MRNSAQIGIMQISSLPIRLTDICSQNVEMIIYERVFKEGASCILCISSLAS